MENTNPVTPDVLVANLRATAEAPRKSASELALEKHSVVQEQRRADRERARKEREQKWKSTKETFTKINYFIFDKEVRDVYLEEAQEKYDKNVAEMKAGLRGIRDEVVGAIDKKSQEFSSFVDKTRDTIYLESRKAAKNLLNAVGRDVVVPIMMEVVKPAVKFVDSLEVATMQTKADMLDAIGKPLAEKSVSFISRFMSPALEAARAANNALTENSRTLESWKKASGVIENKVSNGRDSVLRLVFLGMNLRSAAAEIRQAATSGSRHTERTQTMSRLNADAQNITAQGLV